VLEGAGFEVLTAADGRRAVEVFAERARDIVAVLLDMTMPRFGGEEAYRGLQRIRGDVRVILSSGYNRQEVTSRLSGEGRLLFLQKPYRPSELLDRLRELLEGDAPA
jgi:CheY-like chemotaxis protein